MPGTKEIKNRIKSVQSTRQITKAMEIVSTTKFRKFSRLVQESKPYEESLRKILANISSNIKDEKNELFDGREKVNSIAVIVMTSDRGLCGSFNSFVIKELEKIIKNNSDKKITVIPIGRKVKDYVSKRNYNSEKSYMKISEDEISEISLELSNDITKKYKESVYDEVYVIYNKFYSALRHDLLVEKIIPITRTEEENKIDYIYEPSKEYILSIILPRYINLQIYQAILNNIASEHSARKNAMTNATENADEMLQLLNLKYNRNRQTVITQEITEIVGGASAL